MKARWVVWGVVGLGLVACDDDDEPVETTQASQQATEQIAVHCARSAAGHAYTLGSPGGASDAPEVSLPFALELGSAVPFGDGFAVGALHFEDGKSQALVAWVGPKGGQGRQVQLGRVHGDVEPPRLAARDGRLIAAVSDSDASGATVRLAEIVEPTGRADVRWGATVQEGWDESRVHALSLSGGRGLLVYDRLERGEGYSTVQGAAFGLDALEVDGGARRVTPRAQDAEAPGLVARGGGHWLGWIVRRPIPDESGDGGVDGSAPDAAPPSAQVTNLVDLGYRSLNIAPLDTAGSMVSEPIAVTPQRAHVLVFDMAPLPGGGALLAWREDNTAPGVEGGRVQLGRVRPDASVHRSRVESDDLGAGAPVLLVDPAAPEDGAYGWLAVPGVDTAMRLAAFGEDGRMLGALRDVPVMGRATPVAAHSGRLLLAQPRGRAVELSVVRCGVGVASDAGSE